MSELYRAKTLKLNYDQRFKVAKYMMEYHKVIVDRNQTDVKGNPVFHVKYKKMLAEEVTKAVGFAVTTSHLDSSMEYFLTIRRQAGIKLEFAPVDSTPQMEMLKADKVRLEHEVGKLKNAVETQKKIRENLITVARLAGSIINVINGKESAV